MEQKFRYRVQKNHPSVMSCVTFHNKVILFTVKGCHPLAHPPSWWTTPCLLSATV